jgi:hypothetical protein
MRRPGAPGTHPQRRFHRIHLVAELAPPHTIGTGRLQQGRSTGTDATSRHPNALDIFWTFFVAGTSELPAFFGLDNRTVERLL